MNEKSVTDENLKIGRKPKESLKKTHIAVYMSEERKNVIQKYCDDNDRTTAQLGRELFDKFLHEKEVIK
jgi:hypothetical protein